MLLRLPFLIPCLALLILAAPVTSPAQFWNDFEDAPHNILTAPTAPEGYEHLEAAEKKALYDILRETKPELAALWQTIGS